MPERERESEKERGTGGEKEAKCYTKVPANFFSRCVSLGGFRFCLFNVVPSSRLEEPPSGRRSRAAGAGESRDRERIARMKAASHPTRDRGGGPTFRPGQRDVIRTDTQVGWRTALSPAVGGVRGVRPLTANREANDGSNDGWLRRGGETDGRGKQEMPSCPG